MPLSRNPSRPHLTRGSTKTVVIFQRVIKQYRKPFFEALAAELEAQNVRLRVVYGKPGQREAARADNVSLAAGTGIEVHNLRLLADRLLLQPAFSPVFGADLVIIPQENCYALNYLLLAASLLGLKKVAFWGHGRNRQRAGRGVSEWLKRKMLNATSWWFAYTPGTADYLVRNGVRESAITNVQNSVDTAGFSRLLRGIRNDELDDLRRDLGISATARVGLYCGALTPDKDVEFLIDAARAIRHGVPAFELLILGSGERQRVVEEAARQEEWIHHAGPRFDVEKARHYRLAEVVLNPGTVGLAVLDAFAAGLPLVTTDIPNHGPEIEYLRHRVDGLITSHDRDTYAGEVARLLEDRAALRKMQRRARASSERYTLEAMVGKFREGILACLRA